MPCFFEAPFRGLPYADLRAWHRLFGDRSPRRRHGTGHMLSALIVQRKAGLESERASGRRCSMTPVQEGPWVVTVERPGLAPDDPFGRRAAAGRCAWRGRTTLLHCSRSAGHPGDHWTQTAPDGRTLDAPIVVSVEAFEALEETRRRVFGLSFLPALGADNYDELRGQYELVRRGRPVTLGPLPDGTRIEVREGDYGVLIFAAGLSYPRAYTGAEICAAFNAEMADRYGTEARA